MTCEMWDSYQVIRTTFHFSPSPEVCTVISVHLQLCFTSRPTQAPVFWMVLALHPPLLLSQLAFIGAFILCAKHETS